MYTVTTYFKLEHFYSRPCGRGDLDRVLAVLSKSLFLLTPLREGRLYASGSLPGSSDFYSRPCGRGDQARAKLPPELGRLFLLTPLREGRHVCQLRTVDRHVISTHAPAGGATKPTTRLRA